MKKNKKKITQKILAMVLVLAFMLGVGQMTPQSVYALEFYPDSEGNLNANDEEGYYYQIPAKQQESGECVLYLYSGNKSELVLPQSCDSYKITTVGMEFSSYIELLNAFGSSGELGYKYLTTVKIPSGYKTIESREDGKLGAFQKQKNLYRIEIPESVTSIGEHAFDGCDFNKLTIVTPYGSAAEKYAIAHGIHYTNTKSVAVKTGGTTMYVGEKKTIAVYNNGAKITWKSSNPSVATVNSSGKVTAKKAGTTKITATIGSKNYSYTFQVLKRTEANVLKVIWANYVTADMSDYEKAVAATNWMKANVKTTGTADTPKAALEKGTATYTGYAKAYQKILTHYGMKVKVIEGSDRMENQVKIGAKTYKATALTKAKSIDKTITTTNVESVVLNTNSLTLKVGKTGTFKATGTGKKITWTSGNKKVATVDQKGKVTAKGAGTTKITMKVGKKSYTCTVRVKK